MSFGDRIKTPSRLFAAEFPEMRFFGSRESGLLPALIFRVMELVREQSPPLDNPAYQVLLRLFPGNQESIAYMLELFAAVKANTAQIYSDVFRYAEYLIQTTQVSEKDPSSFDNFCKAAQIKARVDYLGQLGLSSSPVEVFIGTSGNKLALLYPDYTRDSFLDFPCGHFHLKYLYYEVLQKRFEGYAMCYQDVNEAQLKCMCGNEANVGAVVYQSYFDGSFPQSSGEGQTDYQCFACKQPRCDVACNGHYCCSLCVRKNYFTANFRRMPCCYAPIEDSDLSALREVIMREMTFLTEIMQNLQHDKRLKARCDFHKPAPAPKLAPLPNPIAEPVVIEENRPKKLEEVKEVPAVVDQDRFNPQGEEEVPHDYEEKDGSVQNIPHTYISMKHKIPTNLQRADIVQSSLSGDKAGPGDRKPPHPSQNAQRKEKDVVESEEKKQHAALCQTCGSHFTKEDKAYQCREACQCRLCARQWIVGNADSKHCAICRSQYSEKAVNLASRGFRKCHNCQIVVTMEEMDTTGPCGKVCRNCVVLKRRRVLGVPLFTIVMCRCDPDLFFDVNDFETVNIYETARTSMGMSACCLRASGTDTKLRCGHFVCKTHKSLLQFCRRCQDIAAITEGTF